MAAIVIPNNTSFGGMTNQTISRLLQVNTAMERLKDALATASSGYTGVAGTQYEAVSMGMGPFTPNNFGVVPDPATPGAQGTNYEYALNTLAGHWLTFWQAAQPSIEQLDNGSGV